MAIPPIFRGGYSRLPFYHTNGISTAPATDCIHHLVSDRRFAWACPGPAQLVPLIGQKEVVLGLVNEITADFVLTNERLRAHAGNQILTFKEGETDVGEDGGEIRLPVGYSMLHPPHHGLKNLLLARDIEFFALYQFDEIFSR